MTGPSAGVSLRRRSSRTPTTRRPPARLVPVQIFSPVGVRPGGAGEGDRESPDQAGSRGPLRPGSPCGVCRGRSRLLRPTRLCRGGIPWFPEAVATDSGPGVSGDDAPRVSAMDDRNTGVPGAVLATRRSWPPKRRLIARPHAPGEVPRDSVRGRLASYPRNAPRPRFAAYGGQREESGWCIRYLAGGKGPSPQRALCPPDAR